MTDIQHFQAPLKITLEINSLDLSCLSLDPKDTLIISFGSTKTLKKHSFKFKAGQTKDFKRKWVFRVPNANTNVLRCLLSKKKLLGKNEELCKTNIRCADLVSDKTVNEMFELETSTESNLSPSINLRIRMENCEGSDFKDALIEAYSPEWKKLLESDKK